MNMRWVVALCAGVALAGPAAAATLDGATVQVDYLYPDSGTVYGGATGSGPVVVGAGPDAVVNVEGVTDITLDFSGTTLDVFMATVLAAPAWNLAPFNGLRITLLSGGLPAFDGFDLVGGTFGPIVTSFTATELFVNWQGAAYFDGDSAAFRVSFAPVPLPAAGLLLLAGIAGLGVTGRRRAA